MEKELKVINKNGVLLVDSRDVAEMIGKRHTDLMRSIRNYVEVISPKALRESIKASINNGMNKYSD